MSRRDPPNLRPEQAYRTPTTTGDRLVLLLAAGVLAAGGLIFLGNITTPPDDEPEPIARESVAPTVRPTVSLSPSPTEAPQVVTRVVTPGRPLLLEAAAERWGWIRANAEIVIRFAPQLDAEEVGRIQVGRIALVQFGGTQLALLAPGWLRVADPAPQGWIEVDNDGTTLEQFPLYGPDGAGQSVGLAAGSQGFVARGIGPDAEGGVWTTISADGLQWAALSTTNVPDAAIEGLAWGPIGWLAAGGYVPDLESTPWLWQSADGTDWSRVGRLSQPAFEPTALYGAASGYLMRGYARDGEQLWFSKDGVTWSLVSPAQLPAGPLLVSSGPSGFYVWSVDGQPGVGVGAFSRNGADWQALQGGPRGIASQVAVLDDRLIGIDRDPDTDGLRFWVAGLRAGAEEWRETQTAGAFLGDARLATLAGDGSRAVAITWEPGSERLDAWQSADGIGWPRLDTPPDGFGVIPQVAVGGPAGIAVIGEETLDGRRSPAIWRLVGEKWVKVSLADVAARGAAPPEPVCPAIPRDALDFLQLDPGVAAHCFGAADIAFRAWSVACPPCDGVEVVSPYSPAWLSSSSSPISLSPIRSDLQVWSGTSFHPDLEPSPRWVGSWLEVTGHFNDPAAAKCTLDPGQTEIAHYPGSDRVIADCRRRFVITQVTVVDGP